jgi:hypothetical protein
MSRKSQFIRATHVKNIHTHDERTFAKHINVNNPHSVHDGSSLSRLTLLPLFFMLHEAVVSSSAGS